jgi:hypothetical protein
MNTDNGTFRHRRMSTHNFLHLAGRQTVTCHVDHIIGARRDVEQIGGLLDRLTSGEEGSCEEFERHYQQLHTHPPYHSVPEAWMGAYNEYNWAVQNGIDTSQSIYSLCTGGGGSLTYLNYSVARQGVNDSVSHFIAALEMANALLEP